MARTARLKAKVNIRVRICWLNPCNVFAQLVTSQPIAVDTTPTCFSYTDVLGPSRITRKQLASSIVHSALLHVSFLSFSSKDVVCRYCDERGHLSTECWSNPKSQSGFGGTQNKGQPKKSTGKGTGSLEREEQAAVVEQQPQLALATLWTSCRLRLLSDHRTTPEGWLRWTFDTGAATSAFPLDAKRRRMSVATKLLQVHSCPTVEACAYKERLSTGIQGRKADIHKTLISTNKVQCKGHVAVVDSTGGYIILYNSTLARKIQHFVQNVIVSELGALRLYLEKGSYICSQKHVRTRSDQELCSIHSKRQSERGLSALSVGGQCVGERG